ncbi:MAG: HAD family phosphatase [Calditrichaeota bacterium]|nr:MAG: HAD family phosphatase [Calditrichota bacterium]MBL1206138.1 HAD family phosphatase [Calditrichota bacterium]NOG45963.1 HAD family phosphatase [Calditrichota bacterium]
MAIHNWLKNLRAIILDMDGVLVDTEPIHMQAFKIFLEKYNIDSNQEFLISMIGHSVEENFKMLIKKYPQFRPTDFKNLIDERNAIYINLINETSLKPISGIADLIDYCLNNDLKIGLASSSDQNQIEAILQSLKNNNENDIDLSAVFNTIVSGDSVDHKKPAPDIYKKALKNIKINASSAIAIEDSQSGISSAKSAGITCLALKNPYFNIEDIHGQDMILETIHDLVELLYEH